VQSYLNYCRLQIVINVTYLNKYKNKIIYVKIKVVLGI